MISALQKLFLKTADTFDPRDSHILALDLMESMFRLFSLVAIAAYRHAGARDSKINRILWEQLPCPARMSWKVFLQVLAEADEHNFPDHFWDAFLALLKQRTSHSDITGSYDGLRRLADLDMGSVNVNPIYSESISCSPLEFFDAVVAYQSRFTGQGVNELPESALRFSSTLLKGAEELCAELKTIWSACPVYVAKKVDSREHAFFLLNPLISEDGIEEVEATAFGLEDGRLYICFGDRKHPEVESLYPAALWEDGDILFANGARGLFGMEYIGFTNQRRFETSIHTEDFQAFIAPFASPSNFQ